MIKMKVYSLVHNQVTLKYWNLEGLLFLDIKISFFWPFIVL